MPKRRQSAATALDFIQKSGTLLTQNKPYRERLFDVTAELCLALGFVGVAIDTYDPSDSDPFVRTSYPALAADLVEESQATTSPETIAGFVASMRAREDPLVIADPGSLPSTPPKLAAYFRADGVRTLAAFPIVLQEEMIGAFWCSSRDLPERAQRSFGLVQLVMPYLATFIRAALNEARAVLASERLQESEARFRSLVQNASDMISVVDRNGLVTYASPSVERILGYSAAELRGMDIVSFVHPDDRRRAAESLQAVSRKPGAHPAVELRIQHRDGSWRVLETIANNLLSDPAVGGIVHNSRDVTERREAELALRESEQRFRRLAEHSPVGIYQMSLDRTLFYLNPAALEIFEANNSDDVTNAGDDHVFSASALQTIRAEDRKRSMGIASNYEVELTGLRGTRRTVLISGAPVIDGAGQHVQSVIGTITDITERKTLEEALRHQAFHDSLTRLANRARFSDRLEHALNRAQRSGTSLAVLFMDLDDFKSINDRFGHSVGDLILVEVARRLERELRPGDTAARFGGDEFAVLLEEVASLQDVRQIAARVLDALSVPLVWDQKELPIRATIGIAVAGPGSAGSEELLRNADVAMYAAKSHGKGRFELYEEAMHVPIIDRMELLADLRRAVERQEFVVHYQPTVELRSEQITGVEALVRWDHPTRGLLPPNEFIQLAEESGAIFALGSWVLRTACMDMKRWHTGYPAQRFLSLSVNISALQVGRPGFVDEVREVIAASGIAPAALILEVTESLMMRDVESTLRRLEELKSLGIRLAIDDFGTGYSSLSYLSQFPFDILKIDKSFVDGAGDDEGEEELLPAIIDLGKMLKMQTVAEGIERPEQLARLRALACDLGQGFLFARPLEPSAIDELLRQATTQQSDAA